MKIQKGDKVEIMIGKDKGRSGEVLRVFAKNEEIIIKGLNLFKKTLKTGSRSKRWHYRKRKSYES